jgi:hypothetical protein
MEWAGRIAISRSTDGGRSFVRPRRVATFRETASRPCLGEDANIRAIPAQIARCVSPLPQVGVGRVGDVFVTFADLERNRTQGVFLVRLTPELIAGRLQRVGPADSMPSDQFWPALAVDQANGDIWDCYYDTNGDRERRHAWFTCTVSRDGSHWAAPVRAAEAPSDESGHDSDENQYGDYEAVVAARGVAHPFWTDSRDLVGDAEEIYTASIAATALRR